MSNLFDVATEKLRESKFVLVAYFVFAVMCGLGIGFFWEDTISSYLGVKELEVVFDLKPVNFNFTYWAISIAPQIAILGFTYAFATDTKGNRWLLFLVAVFFAVDLVSDWQNRSNGQLLSYSVVNAVGGVEQGIKFNFGASTWVSLFFTLMYFTVMSEIFLSISAGMLISLFPSVVDQYSKTVCDVRKAKDDARRKMSQAHKREQEPQRQQRQQPTHARPAQQQRQPQPVRAHSQGRVSRRREWVEQNS